MHGIQLQQRSARFTGPCASGLRRDVCPTLLRMQTFGAHDAVAASFARPERNRRVLLRAIDRCRHGVSSYRGDGRGIVPGEDRMPVGISGFGKAR